MEIIRKDDGSAVLRFPYSERGVKLARVLGGSYQAKAWHVADPLCVSLITRANDEARRLGRPCVDVATDAVNSIVARSGGLWDVHEKYELPPGKELKPAQVCAVKWCVSRTATLEADPAGAGKMVIGSVVANHLKARRVLIVCMATLKATWRKIYKDFNAMAYRNEVTIATANGQFWPSTDVVIVNFDVIDRFRTKYRWNPTTKENEVVKRGMIDETDWDLVIVDETQCAKGMKALRTQAIVGSKSRGHYVFTPIKGKRRIGLTATPLMNRPIEMFPILHWLWPNSFPSMHEFGVRYCGGHRAQIYKGAVKKLKDGTVVERKAWDMKGATNSEELNVRCRLLGMIARPKEITHADVPKKTRRVVEFERDDLLAENREEVHAAIDVDIDTEVARARALASAVFADEGEWRQAMADLSGSASPANIRTSLELTKKTLPTLIDYTLETLEDPEVSKVVVFVWHKEVADMVERAIPGCLKIYGDTPVDERFGIMEKFQTSPSHRVIVGTIGALGTGTTLTAANRLQFYEYSWVPGHMIQAEDRIHRHTQTREVMIEYLCVEGSVNALKAARLIDKMEVIDRCVGQLREKLDKIPVSITQTEDRAAVGQDLPDLEAMGLSIEDGRIPTMRDALLLIARGQVNKKLHLVDQIVASRVVGNQTWTPTMKALAKILTDKYSVETRDETSLCDARPST